MKINARDWVNYSANQKLEFLSEGFWDTIQLANGSYFAVWVNNDGRELIMSWPDGNEHDAIACGKRQKKFIEEQCGKGLQLEITV